MPPMAVCGQFVSLVRSCYSTTMRFFENDLTIETPVKWYFTSPDAKWCGLPNVFNSRNWYGGTIGWPLLGEVEGAARPWSNGSGGCQTGKGPFGSEDQWLEGASTSEAVDSTPCAVGPGLGMPTVTAFFTTPGHNFFATKWSDDIWYAPLPGHAGHFLTITPLGGPFCCFARGAVVSCTSGPPDFTFVEGVSMGGTLGFCEVTSFITDTTLVFGNVQTE
jgi:hypothetical protein